MWKKIILTGLAVVIAAAGSVVGYLAMKEPDMVEPSSQRVPMTPERIARGKHLFEHVCDCGGCHSERDFSRFGGPIVAEGVGWVFPKEMGLPGTIVAPNLTPDPETGLGKWTDGEKIRAIREGVDRDGRALFPMMPYEVFRKMSDEDVESVVAYLNSLPPVRRKLPRTSVDFPASLLIKSTPKPAGSVPPPDPSNRKAHGEYLATIGGCMDCHTPVEKGRLVREKLLGGGQEFVTPWGKVVTANISKDTSTGIGGLSEDQFIDKFYQYRDYVEKGSPKVGKESFTLMPWLGFSQLSRDELGAIYTFLMSQKAVYNSVETHPAQ